MSRLSPPQPKVASGTSGRRAKQKEYIDIRISTTQNQQLKHSEIGDFESGGNRAPYVASRHPVARFAEREGCVPEWPNGADCKSAAFQLRWFESIRTHTAASAAKSGSLMQDERKFTFAARRSKDSRKNSAKRNFCGNSSVDRALAFQAGGRGFESRFPLHC